MLDESQTILESGEDGEFALEGVLPEEQVEDRVFLVHTRLPIAVTHRDLVEIGQQRLHQRVLAVHVQTVVRMGTIYAHNME